MMDIHSKNAKKSTIKQNLQLFGLESREQDIYLILLRRNWLTALQVARLIAIPRPTVYRLLEALADKGLVETKIDDKTTFYNASSPSQLKNLISDQEAKVSSMREAYTQLESQLIVISSAKENETNVKFYRGLNGLQYMEFKKLYIKRGLEILIYDTNQWYVRLGNDFAEDIRQKYIEYDCHIRELQNRKDTEAVGADATCSWTTNSQYLRNHYRHRVLPEKVMRIKHDVYIFDDYIHFHGYREDEFFGIEIFNRDYAEMFRQLFEFLWSQSKSIDKFG
jgi:predicted transcriptional regulator